MGNRESLKGSADSLGLDLHEELLKFHEKYYSSDLMKLVVCGNQSLDQLTKWVAEKFSEIQRKDDARAICSVHPLGKEQVGRIVHFESLTDRCIVRLVFALPEIKALYRCNAIEYAVSLLTRQGKGSLISYLKAQGWATDVAAETDSLLCSNFNHLYIDITATPLGLQNYKEIVRALFVYLQQITKDGPSERYYNELCIIKKLKFENYEKKAQAPWVLKLAEAIHNRYILPEDVISSNDLLGPFDSS
ncbi:metalloprotease, partial [Coemansia sp. RSA 2599]